MSKMRNIFSFWESGFIENIMKLPEVRAACSYCKCNLVFNPLKAYWFRFTFSGTSFERKHDNYIMGSSMDKDLPVCIKCGYKAQSKMTLIDQFQREWANVRNVALFRRRWRNRNQSGLGLMELLEPSVKKSMPEKQFDISENTGDYLYNSPH